MRRLVNSRAVGVVLGLLLFWAFVAPANSEPAALPYHRGVAISHSMGWADIGPAREFVYPAFVGAGRELKRSELVALRDMGFDFVRFAIDPGPFLQFTGARRDELDRILVERVTMMMAAGLSVIVDFHPSDLHPDFLDRKLTTGVNSPAFQSYLRLLERTATLLDRFKSPRVALEIMNEPPVSGAVWQPMLDAAYKTIRARTRDLVIVASDGLVHLDKGLKTLTPYAGDPAVLFSFHYYDPLEFTHQGASWSPTRYLADVAYPARARPITDARNATADVIVAAPLSGAQRSLAMLEADRYLSKYQARAFDRSEITRYFDIARNWAQSKGIALNRMLVGEFGARKWEPLGAPSRAAERARWYRDVREEAEVHGFSWAVWAFSGGGGFALSDDGSVAGIDPALRRALGLNAVTRGMR